MKLNFNISQQWNELNEHQRDQISSILLTSNERERGVFFALLFYLFCPNKWCTLKGARQAYRFFLLINQTGIKQLLPYCDFLFTDFNLTRFPKKLKVKGSWYYGPANRLANLTIEELAFADRFFYDWRVNNSAVDLDRLVTTLYRPKRKDNIEGDVREPFNEFSVADRGGILPRMPQNKKYAIGLAYQGSRELIFGRYPTLFPKHKKQEKQDNEGKEKKPPAKYQGFTKMMISMSMGENLPLGPLQEVKKTLANTFFDIVQESIITARKKEQELKKRSKK